mmetsp:Transcript_12061/g.18570  ORF Transcript_12061/g.18570 Transcript_12061/m.18570 type:complete len:236 (+) Transcript_12061:125-832(+)
MYKEGLLTEKEQDVSPNNFMKTATTQKGKHVVDKLCGLDEGKAPVATLLGVQYKEEEEELLGADISLLYDHCLEETIIEDSSQENKSNKQGQTREEAGGAVEGAWRSPLVPATPSCSDMEEATQSSEEPKHLAAAAIYVVEDTAANKDQEEEIEDGLRLLVLETVEEQQEEESLRHGDRQEYGEGTTGDEENHRGGFFVPSAEEVNEGEVMNKEHTHELQPLALFQDIDYYASLL